jgi:hypothetical protein
MTTYTWEYGGEAQGLHFTIEFDDETAVHGQEPDRVVRPECPVALRRECDFGRLYASQV